MVVGCKLALLIAVEPTEALEKVAKIKTLLSRRHHRSLRPARGTQIDGTLLINGCITGVGYPALDETGAEPGYDGVVEEGGARIQRLLGLDYGGRPKAEATNHIAGNPI